MTRRFFLAALTLVCLISAWGLLPAECLAASKDKSPKPPAPALAASSTQTELNAAIEKILVKNNRVFIVLNRTGSGKIAPEDYPKIMLRLQTSKEPRQWSLTEVDKTRSLGAGSGRVEFDTGIVLEKGETVKAVLSLGKIEKTKQEMLVIAPAPSGTKPGPVGLGTATMRAEVKRPTKDLSPMNKAMAGAINRRSATHTSRPMELDDAGGIRITTPGEGQVQKPGDDLYVISSFRNALPDPTALEYVEFALRKWGVPDVFATMRQPYRQSSDDRNCATHITIPTRGLPLGSDYYITATHPQAWGIGNTFSIQTPGEGQIRVIGPHSGDVIIPGSSLNIQYQFSRHVGSGPMSFELYKLDADGRYGSPAVSFTRNFRSGAAGPAEPIHTLSYNLPGDLDLGQYVLQITHPEASGRSSTFSVGLAEIRIFRPRAGENLTPSFPMTVQYQLSRSVGSGFIQFNLYKVGEGPEAYTEGDMMRHDEIATFTRTYRPGAAGAPEPIHSFEYTLPRDLAVGQYYLTAQHAAVSGRSATRQAVGKSSHFNAIWEMGGEETVTCDFRIDSSAFKDGRSLGDGVTVSPDQTVRDEFRVGVRWNGIRVPEGHYAYGARPYAIGVYSAITGEEIVRKTFAYVAQTNRNVDIIFEFDKDRIPAMKRGTVIPLEFRLEKATSDAIDHNPDNNLFTADMGVSTLVENNMELDLDSDDLSITRRSHLFSDDEYHLTQSFKVKNRSGGTTNVQVKGCLYRRDGSETWSEAHAYTCQTITVNNVGASWVTQDFSYEFWEESPWDIPVDTRFRLILEADPNRMLIDSDRSNNKDFTTFQIWEPAPGSGSGTVVGH